MKRKFSTSFKIDFARSLICCAALALAILSAGLHWHSSLVALFAILYILCLIWSISKPLFSKERLVLFDWAEVAFHFASIIVLGIVDIVSFKDFFSGSVIQIVCVIASGLFTLYGVALTTKFNMWNEQDKERARAKPHLFSVGDEVWNSLDVESIKTTEIKFFSTSLEKADKRKSHYEIGELRLYNSDISSCFLKGIFINWEYFLIFDYDEALKKDSYYCFTINFPFEAKSVWGFHLIVEDALGNIYLCSTITKAISSKRTKCEKIMIKGIFKIDLRNDIICDKIIRKYREKERKCLEKSKSKK